jgi:nucleotide-binding universal stress UspA family protein
MVTKPQLEMRESPKTGSALSSIKSVLVYLAPKANVQGVLDVALDLARRHKAHIVGLSPGSEAAGPIVLTEEARTLEQTFRDQAIQVQLSHEWSHVRGDEEAIIALESRTHDMLVLGQADPSERRLWPQVHHLLESTLVKGGHPLIAVPHQGSFPNVGERVLVAWNGAREAARAVEDAMAILEKADEVIVLTVDDRSGDAVSVDHLVGLLERHGVNVSAQGARTSGRAIGDVLLSKARELRCDLLVMGGYGHSRLREHLLGGATYFVLEHMNIPVLLSH